MKTTLFPVKYRISEFPRDQFHRATKHGNGTSSIKGVEWKILEKILEKNMEDVPWPPLIAGWYEGIL